MDELSTWLSSQHPGLHTYKAFLTKTLLLSASSPENRALYTLLAAIAGRYIELFDEAPLPVQTAEHAYRTLVGIVAEAENSITAPASQRIRTLNSVASVELF